MTTKQTFDKNLTVFIQLDMDELEYLKIPEAITRSLTPTNCKSSHTLSRRGGPYSAIEFSSQEDMKTFLKNVSLESGMKIVEPDKVPFL